MTVCSYPLERGTGGGGDGGGDAKNSGLIST